MNRREQKLVCNVMQTIETHLQQIAKNTRDPQTEQELKAAIDILSISRKDLQRAEQPAPKKE